jgi:hypothetical protein
MRAATFVFSSFILGYKCNLNVGTPDILKKPLKYIAAISVELAPGAELAGPGTRFLREARLSHLRFELSRYGWKRRNRVSPVRIPRLRMNGFATATHDTPLA